MNMMSGSEKRLRHLTYVFSLVIHGAFAVIFAFITFKEDTSIIPFDKGTLVEFYEEERPSPEPKRDTRPPTEPAREREKVDVAAVARQEEKEEKLPVTDYEKETVEFPSAHATLTHPDYAKLFRDLLSQPEKPGPLSTHLREDEPPAEKKPEPEELLIPKAGKFPPLPPIDPKGRGPRERTSTGERLEDHIRGVRRDIMRNREALPLTAIPLIVSNLLNEIFGVGRTSSEKQQKRISVAQLWSISEKELRVMIVLWSNGQVNPFKLTRHERLFFRMSEIQTQSYFEYLKIRGFVSPGILSGQIFYRPNITRREVLDAFMARLTTTGSDVEKKVLTGHIELLKKCYDYSKGRVTIHE